MRRDACGMLFWALRWHEGRRVSTRVLCDVLWGDFGSKPQDPIGSLRELMAYTRKRFGGRWIIEECNGRAYRLTSRPVAARHAVRVHRHHRHAVTRVIAPAAENFQF